MGREDGALFAGDVLGPSVLVANRVLDLFRLHPSSITDHHTDEKEASTHVHVDLHSIALVAINNGRDHDQCISSNKVSDASRLGVARGFEVELEAVCASNQQQ